MAYLAASILALEGEVAEAELPRGASAVATALLAEARTTRENAYKTLLVERTLAAALAEARS